MQNFHSLWTFSKTNTYNGTILHLARLNPWIFTVLQDFSVEVTYRAIRQKNLTELSLAQWSNLPQTKLLIHTNCRFVEQWEPQKICDSNKRLPHDLRKADVFKMNRGWTIVIHSPFFHEVYIAVNRYCWDHYIGPYLGSIHKCSIAERTKITYRTLHLAQMCPINLLASFLQIKTAVWTKACLVPLEIHFNQI